MKNKYIPMMVITFISLAFAAFSTILNIVRQEIGSSIFSFIMAVLAACWFGILVVAAIREQWRLKRVKRIEAMQKQFLETYEEIREEQNQVQPFEEFNGVKDGKKKSDENGKSD